MNLVCKCPRLLEDTETSSPPYSSWECLLWRHKGTDKYISYYVSVFNVFAFNLPWNVK